MPVVLLVVAVLAALAVAGAALFRLHRLRRALIAERASRRLAGGMQARDLDAFRSRVAELLQDREVLAEADRILDTALATHRTEGGSP